VFSKKKSILQQLFFSAREELRWNLPAQQSETLRLEMLIKRNHFCSMRRRKFHSGNGTQS